MKKRFLSVVLCLCMVVGLLPTTAMATSKTADDAINWVKSKLGQTLSSGECVNLVALYYEYLGEARPVGNAVDYITKGGTTLPNGWQRLQGVQPQKGDILIYAANDQFPYGHVAIYESDRSHYHQNFDKNRFVTQVTYRYDGLYNPYWGVIRPNWTSSTDNVTVNWEDYWRHSISTDGPYATLARKATIIGAYPSGAEIGIYLYDSSGTLVASKREGVAPENGIVVMWYDVLDSVYTSSANVI